MQKYKTQEFIDSLTPMPGMLLIQLVPEDNSFYSGGLLTMVEAPRQPFTARVIRKGGDTYRLGNGTEVTSLIEEGKDVIFDPTSYPSHLSFTVEGKEGENPTIYRLVPEYVVVGLIGIDK